MNRPVDLSGQPPTWPAEARRLWDACIRSASRVTDLWRMPAPRGDDLLREHLSRLMATEPDRLTITAGARASALTYARVDRVIAMERPTFGGVVAALQAGGADVSLYEWNELLGDEPPDAPTWWLTSPWRNPDGASLSAADRALLARRVASGGRVVLNVAYLWYRGQPSVDSLGVPGADLVGTLHKLAGHGVRLGWVASADYFDRAFAELLGTTPPPVWQRAWGLFLRDEGLQLLQRHSFARARAASAAFHDRLGLAGDSPHVLLPLAGSDEAAALVTLSRKGFRLSPGSAFHSPAPTLRACFTGVRPEEATEFADVARRSGLFAVTK